MSEGITVLACGVCRTPLSGLSSDSAFLCGGCGRGWGIGKRGLEQLHTSVRTGSNEGGLPLPFWLVEADTTVHSRLTRRELHTVGLQRGRWFAPGMETGLRETGGFHRVRRLVVPAFSLNGLFDLGVRLSAAMNELPPETHSDWPSLAGVFSGIDEVQNLVRGICVGQEAAAEDWLADVKIDVVVRSLELLVLPAEVEGEMVLLRGTGVSFFRRNMPDLERIQAFHTAAPR